MNLLMRYSGFRSVWVGQLLSQLGNAVFYILGLWEIQLKSPVLLSVAGVVTTVPILFGMFGGVMVDRYDPRRLMFLTDVMRGLAVGLGILALLRPGHLIAVIIILLGINSLGGAIFSPAETVMIPRMVEDRDLVAANGLYSVTSQVSSALGYALGGAAVALIGVRVVFGIDMGSFWASAVAILLMMRTVTAPRSRSTAPHEGLSEEKPSGFLANFKEGMAGFRALPWLGRILPAVILVNLGFVAAFTMLPYWVHHHLHGSASWYGIIEAAWAVGMICGSLLSGRASKWPLRSALAFLFGIQSVFIMGFTFSRWPLVSAAMLFLAGLVNGAGNAVTFALLQRVIPESVRGRVFGLIVTLFGLANPLGAIAAGALLHVLPIYWSWGLAIVTGFIFAFEVWRIVPNSVDDIAVKISS